MGKIVGRVVEVKGLFVKAKLSNLLPPYLVTNGISETSPRINGFVKTRVGIETIICQVVGEYCDEINDTISGHFLEVQVRGNINNGKFVQGLRMLPIVSSSIETLDEYDYKLIYDSSNGESLSIGVDLFDSNKIINTNVNKLIPSHIGVFGNTGSGKSNTLVRVLKEYEKLVFQKKTNRGKFIVFDLNNEYSKNAICDESHKQVYNLTTRKNSERKLPLSLGNLSEDQFIVLMNASEKTQVPVVKNAYRHTFINDEIRSEQYYLDSISSMILNSRKSLFLSMRYHLSKYFKNIENFKYHNNQNAFYYQDNLGKITYSNQPDFSDYLKFIEVQIPKEPLDRFIFELYFSIAYENENGVQLDFMMPLISRANKLINDFKKVFNFTDSKSKNRALFGDKNVCVVQLGDVNKDMKEIITSIISSIIFDSLASNKDEKGEIVQIVNIVIDEAHNILYDDGEKTLSHKAIIEVFEKIVKEGRKFGCFLTLSSQRPSDISQTIISQLHNYFLHKLVNPTDIQKIRKAVAYLDENSMDFLTVLAPGECIVSGTAFQMPSFIYVNQVDLINRPNSENAKLVGENGLFDRESIFLDKSKNLF